MQLMWSQKHVDCSPESFQLQAVTLHAYLPSSYAPQIQQLGKHGLKLVTLTQKNRESLEGCVEDLREAWKKLRGAHRTRRPGRGGCTRLKRSTRGEAGMSICMS